MFGDTAMSQWKTTFGIVNNPMEEQKRTVQWLLTLDYTTTNAVLCLVIFVNFMSNIISFCQTWRKVPFKKALLWQVATRYCWLSDTVGIRCIQLPDVFPLTSIVNKSCNIDCCVNNMLQIIQNMMVSQGLGLELHVYMFGRNTISGQHLLI